MKYNTISTSSLSSEGRKSTLTLYTDPDFLNDKVSSSESEISSVRSELQIAQRALTLQTRRCRQLVAEYTRRLQEKEAQYQSEKLLREDQLAKVLRALLIFEARLKQEQKFITHQLAEKDRIIKKQREHIHSLSSNAPNNYCKHCTYYGQKLESLGSSSEYVVTDYQDSNISNLESLDSSSETYATISNDSKDGSSPELVQKDPSLNKEQKFQKNKFKDAPKRGKRLGHRKSIGDYYEVLKMRNEQISPSSDNTSNDYERIDPQVPPESAMHSQISEVSNRIESIFQSNMTLTEDNLGKHDQLVKDSDSHDDDPNERTLINDDRCTVRNSFQGEIAQQQQSKINENIQVFEDESNETNNWYASASDPEDDDIRRVNANPNPNFLECMNQILLQNVQDNINSPPKTPTMERKSQKRVKFSDENDLKESQPLQLQEVKQLNAANINHKMADYYETPIQKTNFYETPQSIYSNDYEQIMSKSSEKSLILKSPQEESHYYVDMDTSSLNSSNGLKSPSDEGIIRKSKILRTPPALPPKPANLLSKYKIHSPTKVSTPSIDSEPDYCSISELNLPSMGVSQVGASRTSPSMVPIAKKLHVVAEINVTQVPHTPDSVILHSPKMPSCIPPPAPSAHVQQSHYDLDRNEHIVASKAVEKVTIQMAKTSPTSSKPPKFEKVEKLEKVEAHATPQKHEPEIPKLPQVSEILIPDEDAQPPESPKKDERIISHDNYIKINAQIFKHKISPKPDLRRPILIGSSVSSLITTFNNQQLLAEMSPTKSPPRGKLNKKLFSSFENLQNLERHEAHEQTKSPELVPSFEFDLSQNFEEFKLDECDMDEYGGLNQEEMKNSLESKRELPDIINKHSLGGKRHNGVEIIRATNPNPSLTIIQKQIHNQYKPNELHSPKLKTNAIELLNHCLEKKNGSSSEKENENECLARKKLSEPTYEHFLECTGLSSKSILTPARSLSNHKGILKPRDVKYRSKAKQGQGNTIKYWSEPYI